MPVLGKGTPTPATPRKAESGQQTKEGLQPPQATHSDSPDLPTAKKKSQKHAPVFDSKRGDVANPLLQSLDADGSPLAFFPFRSADYGIASPISQSPPVSWFHTQFTIIGELGKGNFGHVVRAQNMLDGMPYAVKILDTVIKNNRELARRIDEAKVMARCSSQYIIRYFSCWIEERHLYLQMEYCSGGNLAVRIERMAEQGLKWEEPQVTALLLQMTSALYHLHEEVGVAHLDVKPENIYICGDGVSYKLGDFGHAHFLDSSPAESQKATTTQSMDSLVSRLSDVRFSLEEGDIRYLPLEMLNDKSYLKEADIFSLGVSIHEVVTGQQPPLGSEHPWASFREAQLDVQQLAAANPGFGKPLFELLRSMLALEPTHRPSALQVLTQHRSLFCSSASVSTSAIAPWDLGLFTRIAQTKDRQHASDSVAKAP